MNIFLLVNASLSWLTNVSCSFLSVPTNQRPSIFFKTMNVTLLVPWSFFNFFAIVQPTSVSHQQATNLFQQHWRHLNGSYEYDFNSAFEKADRSLEQKRTSTPLYKNRQLTILNQQQFTFTERKTFLCS